MNKDIERALREADAYAMSETDNYLIGHLVAIQSAITTEKDRLIDALDEAGAPGYGQLADEEEHEFSLVERIKAFGMKNAALVQELNEQNNNLRAIILNSCECERPMIICDNRGCHCSICGLPE